MSWLVAQLRTFLLVFVLYGLVFLYIQNRIHCGTYKTTLILPINISIKRLSQNHTITVHIVIDCRCFAGYMDTDMHWVELHFYSFNVPINLHFLGPLILTCPIAPSLDLCHLAELKPLAESSTSDACVGYMCPHLSNTPFTPVSHMLEDYAEGHCSTRYWISKARGQISIDHFVTTVFL